MHIMVVFQCEGDIIHMQLDSAIFILVVVVVVVVAVVFLFFWLRGLLTVDCCLLTSGGSRMCQMAGLGTFWMGQRFFKAYIYTILMW